MKETSKTYVNPHQEVNLKLFFNKILSSKIFFTISIGTCVAIAFVYIKLATPTYEVSTSILIDASGNNRALGESQYVKGGVSLIETEKNLANEIGIIKSFSLVKQTVEDLEFHLTYHSGKWWKMKEHYGYFPIEVILLETGAQLLNTPFNIEIISKDKYRLSIVTDKFMVANRSNDSNRYVEKEFSYTKEYSFGEVVSHDYFNLIIKKPDYKIIADEFNELDLSFIVRNLNEVASGYLYKLTVNNINYEASIFKFTSYGAVVDKEIDFLKKLTENYIQNKLISRNKIATSKVTFIQNQLMVISDSLLKAELNLESYKRDQHATNLGVTASNAIKQIENLQIEKAKIDLNVKYYNSLIKYLEDNLTREDFTVPTAIGLDDPILNENITELKRLHSEKTKKEFYVTKNNQEMEILLEQIKESADLLMSNLRNSVKSSELALQEVNKQLSIHNEEINSLPMREKQLVSIQRQSALYENLYNYLSQELAKTGIARAESQSDTRILDPPRMVGYGPVAPKKMMIMLLALVIGTIIPLGWIVLRSTLDDTLNNVGQITEHTSIPVLASIAHYNSKSELSDKDDSRWKVKESFRDLSANLRFILPKNKNCIIGVTSTVPNEGKSFCALNLGITLAEAGNNTLIIDTDLRDPSLIRDNTKFEGRGLSNYLQGDISKLNEIIYTHDKLNHLSYIPTPVVEGNVPLLLSSNKMESLILTLKDKYDYIILDTPAFGMVSDFLILAEFVDMNLFVIRKKISKVAYLRDFEKMNYDSNKKKSGIIFNDTMGKDFKYGYGYKYGVNREPQFISDYLS